MDTIKIAIPFGGNDGERGISLASARTLNDHLPADRFNLEFYYFSPSSKVFRFPVQLLYKNTCEDFDYQMQQGNFNQYIVENPFDEIASADLVFPAGHGRFFEDGKLQREIESRKGRVVGCDSEVCELIFHKDKALKELEKHKFINVPTCVFDKPIDDEKFLRTSLTNLGYSHGDSFIIKPSTSGSSIGVHSISNDDGIEKVQSVINSLLTEFGSPVLVQIDCKKQGWREFTINVVAGLDGNPVAFVPTEIECEGVFTFRLKYLFNSLLGLHLPPRFKHQDLEAIRTKSEELFKVIGMQDFCRIDGWLSNSGEVYFSDFNVITGLGQSSLFFQQAFFLGFSHKEILCYLIENSLRRHGINKPLIKPVMQIPKRKMFVLFGGDTNERETSIESGVNVWLKLSHSKKYYPSPWLLVPSKCTGDFDVWSLPGEAALYHSVEDIERVCEQHSANSNSIALFRDLRKNTCDRLGLTSFDSGTARQMPLEEFLKHARQEGAYVFNAVHGGIGENGVLQRKLAAAGVDTNGSCAEVSKLCMDKVATSRLISSAQIDGVVTSFEGISANHLTISGDELQKSDAKSLWTIWAQHFSRAGSDGIILKPSQDGCSTGVVRIRNANDLDNYITALKNNDLMIPAGKLQSHDEGVEMPRHLPNEFLMEEFVVTDDLEVCKHNGINLSPKTGWIEVTIGCIGYHGAMYALQPSITVKPGGGVLPREYKFTMGVGVNLTPPPNCLVSTNSIVKFRDRIQRVANVIGLHGFARVDAFLHRSTGDAYIIEINTIPGMTPATVLFHQGLAEDSPMMPAVLLETIADFSVPQTPTCRNT